MRLQIDNIDFDNPEDLDTQEGRGDFSTPATNEAYDGMGSLFEDDVGSDFRLDLDDVGNEDRGTIDLDTGVSRHNPVEEFMSDEVDSEPEGDGIERNGRGFNLDLSSTKKTALLSIGIGLVILIIVLIIINITANKGENLGGDVEDLEETNEAGGTEASGDTSVGGVVSTWVPVTDVITLKSTKTGRFTVSTIQSYGTTIGDKLEVKTVATGELVGYGNGYEILIPNQLTNSVKQGSMITVTYRTGVIGDTVVIGDIKPITSD